MSRTPAGPADSVACELYRNMPGEAPPEALMIELHVQLASRTVESRMDSPVLQVSWRAMTSTNGGAAATSPLTRGLGLRLALAAACALAMACATSGGQARHDPPRGPASVACGAHAELHAGLRAPGTALLFGEIHGVEEFPAFFGEAVCGVARSGAEVTAALEIPGSQQEAVERFLASGGGKADMAALLASPFWSREYQDGRSSKAMAALLERLRGLRAAGLGVRVFLFDVEQAGQDRDERMAERLSGSLRDHPRAVLMALTGNYHARTAPGAPWNPDWRPMGWYLRASGARVTSLDGAGPGGTAWVCMTAVAKECGARSVTAPRPPGERTDPRVELIAAPSPEGFSGYYVTASVTASPPGAR